ncbi:nucleoside phosphorylase [Lactiplantibacillus sp. WILCCON 0030]|uniref:Uridine phosphorylase n=1 Tax=Lactiplantibacillus brownii TaxID=3069269 RepID=A0ABU1A8B7_9LACO|nr:nucleoside phosphorylase [Lactiplantibacillus brownii]MDQ7937179.1 nucleoside phosphorylase [Lactiplantibacillus brownii]
MRDELTLLHFDDDPEAVLSPSTEGNFKLPEKALLMLTDDQHFQQIVTHYHGVEVAHFDSITKVARVYQVNRHGQKIAMAQAPLGAPGAVMILESLIAFGVRQVLGVGSCGALTELPENIFLSPTAALRDEGTSFHYLPASEWATVDPTMVAGIQKGLLQRHIPVRLVKTWTTDAIFRENKSRITSVKLAGCEVVEMECAALVACAKFRKIKFGQLLYTADSLANLDRHDPRQWGTDAVIPAIELAIEILVELPA